MNTQARSSFALRIPGRLAALFASVMLSLVSAVTASAGPNDVLYSPLSRTVEGIMPYSKTYTVSVLSPNNFPAGASRTVNIELSATSFSEGDEATALSYVTFLDTVTQAPITTLTFTGPAQVRSFTVQVAIPLIGISGAGSSASFAYRIATTNWGLMSDGGTVVDGGTNINAIASVDPSGDPNRLPPLIAITTPADGQVFTPTSLPTTIPVSFQATARAGFPVVSVDATLDGVPLTVTASPAGPSTSVTGTASLVITAAGTYTIRANAHNSVGDATDANTFTVTFGGPPVAVINTPINNANYTLRTGSSITIPYTFTATSPSGGITSLDVRVDGQPVTFTSTGLGTTTVTGQTDLLYTTGGAHTVTVSATNAVGTSLPATADFTISVVSPVPAISIALTGGTSYTIPSGAASMSIPFTLNSTSTNGFTVDAVSATWSGAAPALSHSPALGTASAITSNGTLLNVGPGTYTINATATSAGIVSAPATATFTVSAAVQQPLPTVVINTPAVGSTYTIVTGGSTTIPLTFTGTSNATGGVITALSAKLGTTALAVTATNLGQKTANGSANITVSAAGTYTIAVTATDAYGVASATRTFTVTVVQPKNICGTVFYDVDADGTLDCGEFGLASIGVNLVNSSGLVVATTTTNSCGSYTFCNIVPGTYTVVAVPYAGLKPTTTGSRSITVSTSNVTVSAIGLGLDFAAIRTMTANGYTIGYWKNNLDKAITGKTSGIQVPVSTLNSYTNKIGDFALSPYDCISLKSASATMGTTSSAPKDLLSKQLIASEYNYQNGAYIGGNKNLTFVFLWWGEYVLKNYSSCSSTYIIWTKDWFDAYNNTHGGAVAGPN